MLCANKGFNRVTPSGLLAKEHTLKLLEILVKDRDWRVVLSKPRLRASHLWNFVEEVQQGSLIPPLKLLLLILYLRHVIHVVYG